MEVSVETMQMILYGNYAVTTSVEFMQVLRWYFVTGMLVDLSVAIMQLEVFAAHTQVTVSAANMWVTIFVVIMLMKVSVAIMQVVFFAVHFAHGYFYCIYVGHSFFYSHVGDSFKLKFHIPFTD